VEKEELRDAEANSSAILLPPPELFCWGAYGCIRFFVQNGCKENASSTLHVQSTPLLLSLPLSSPFFLFHPFNLFSLMFPMPGLSVRRESSRHRYLS